MTYLRGYAQGEDGSTYNCLPWGLYDNSFLGRLSCSPCYSNPEGNTLVATVKLLEVLGSITAGLSNGTIKNTRLIVLWLNPLHNQNITRMYAEYVLTITNKG